MTAPQAQPVSAPDGAYLDAHVHFWDPGRFRYPWLSAVPDLNRPFLPADLRADGAGPIGVVAVEADRAAGQALAEARWLGDLGQPGLPVVGVVAHAPLQRGTSCARHLERLASMARVVGTRRLLQDETPGFTIRGAFARGVELLATKGIPLDLCVRRHQLVEMTLLARRFPQVSFVLDHLGKPAVTPESLPSWATGLRRLAASPNVRCKLSGLATEAAPDRRGPRHVLPFLRQAIDAFGPDRCMFGSDWPVLTTAMSYQGWLDLVREAVQDLSSDERDQVLRRTALETYSPAADRGRTAADPSGSSVPGGQRTADGEPPRGR